MAKRNKEDDFRTVYIVGQPPTSAYHSMFRLSNKWMPVDNIEDADLVQFCGGEDVCPSMYGEKVNPKTHFNVDRDVYEKALYEMCIDLGKPMAGICRGAQFLHVMNGGSLWQHVEGHRLAHMAYFHTFSTSLTQRQRDNLAAATKSDRSSFFVTSTHHQMMRIPRGAGVVLLTAEESTLKEGEVPRVTTVYNADGKKMADIESIWYPKTRVLCYQPHPEYARPGVACQTFYFSAIDNLLFDKGAKV